MDWQISFRCVINFFRNFKRIILDKVFAHSLEIHLLAYIYLLMRLDQISGLLDNPRIPETLQPYFLLFYPNIVNRSIWWNGICWVIEKAFFFICLHCFSNTLPGPLRHKPFFSTWAKRRWTRDEDIKFRGHLRNWSFKCITYSLAFGCI